MEKTLEKCTAYINQYLFGMETVIQILWNAYITKNNVILYGPPGHAKSAVVELFFKYITTTQDKQNHEHKEWVIFTPTQDPDVLKGGLDVAEYQQNSELLYKVENSLFAYKYVILEEFFDSPDSVLLELKQPLTSGYFSNGKQQVPIKCEMIVICTNRTPQEFEGEDTTRAILERFIYKERVAFDKYDRDLYDNILSTIPNVDKVKLQPFIKLTLEINRKSLGQPISPRTFIKAAKAFNTLGNIGLVGLDPYGKHVTALIEDQRRVLEEMRRQKAWENFVQAIGLDYEFVKTISNGTDSDNHESAIVKVRTAFYDAVIKPHENGPYKRIISNLAKDSFLADFLISRVYHDITRTLYEIVNVSEQHFTERSAVFQLLSPNGSLLNMIPRATANKFVLGDNYQDFLTTIHNHISTLYTTAYAGN